MKLWIDDIRNAPDSDEWITCRTVTSAINALYQFGSNFDEISFDHDISHQITVGNFSRPLPCDETFRPVAHYLGARRDVLSFNGVTWNPTIIIHSANPVGAREIESILSEYGLSAEVAPLAQVNRLEATI